MCLHANNQNAVQATEDIVCYKTVLLRNIDGRPCFTSLYQGFPYRLGDIQVCTNFVRYVANCCVSYGFHSFALADTARIECDRLVSRLNVKGVMLLCIIPKGAWYYCSRHPYMYCSDTIQIAGWKYRDDPEWTMMPEKKKTTLLEKLKSFFKK